ncbi:NADH:flavin oxidoreductase/NADH oxidase [Lasiodiplodia theobromae]|nr:NADH:flavin oxidoreductase/NADH oxidase [Lasiodiplodia theobromae]
MAPLTRFRADENHVPTDAMVEYYSQRASVPGTLLLTEATFISERSGGYANIPGLWTLEQLDAWKKVTDAVHAKGSKIYVQLWALGRAAEPEIGEGSGGALYEEGFTDIVSASDVPMLDGLPKPRPLEESEIWGYVKDYASAAKMAVVRAGFDGVEIHAANGYLIDQFIQDVSNHRTDQWGGNIANRARFAFEVAQAVSEAVGPDRVGIRLSPFSEFQSMRMSDPVPQFRLLISALRKLDLAYLHLIEPRIAGYIEKEGVTDTLDFALEAWGKQKPVLLAGGFKPDSAKEIVSTKYPEYNMAVVFGRLFISTPDLVYRIQKGIPPNPYDRKTFYRTREAPLEVGYTDYPFSTEFTKEFGALN